MTSVGSGAGSERVWFDIYYGGTWTAPADMYIDFDNAVIAWDSIGPVGDGPPGTGGGGTGGSGAGASGTGGSGATSQGGTSTAPPVLTSDGEDDGGCGCRIATKSSPSGAPATGFVWLAALMTIGARRRNRR